MSVISSPLNRFLAAIAPPVAAIVLVTFVDRTSRRRAGGFTLGGQKEIELRAEGARFVYDRFGHSSEASTDDLLRHGSLDR